MPIDKLYAVIFLHDSLILIAASASRASTSRKASVNCLIELRKPYLPRSILSYYLQCGAYSDCLMAIVALSSSSSISLNFLFILDGIIITHKNTELRISENSAVDIVAITFGVGWSILSHYNRLPYYLKIDANSFL